MRILLTGATGFIGSHVARLLAREGLETHAIVRPHSDVSRVADVLSALRVEWCDLHAFGDLDRCLERVRPDLCLHLAWYTEPGQYLTSTENLRMVGSTLHLASKLADLGCTRFVAAGTCFEYDTSLGRLSETSATGPRSLYAACKLALQLMLERWSPTSGVSVAWLRLFYQYGPWEDTRRLVPSIICSLLRNEAARLTNGEQRRDFLHVEDVAAAIAAVARSQLTGVVNIGSGQTVAVRDLAIKIGELVGRPELIVLGARPRDPGDPACVWADTRRLRDHTTWMPRVDLEDGLRGTVDWWTEWHART